MSNLDFAGKQALIDRRLTDVIDEIDTAQSLMSRLRSQADSMALVLKSVTLAEQYLNFSYVDSVLCKYVSVMSDNNRKLQMVLNEEHFKRNFTYNEKGDFVNYSSEPVLPNTLYHPDKFYSLKLTNTSSEQTHGQYFEDLTGTNVQLSENLENALGGNYDVINSASDNGGRDQIGERYTHYSNNDLLTVQDLRYASISNINENRKVRTQDIKTSELNRCKGDEVVRRNANTFVCNGETNNVTVQPVQHSQLVVNDVEVKQKRNYNGEKDERKFYEEEKGGQYYEEERCYNEVKEEYDHEEEEQSSEESDKLETESWVLCDSNDSLDDFDIPDLINNSSQEIGCCVTNEREQENGKGPREYTAKVTHAVSPSEIYIRFVQENCPLLHKLQDELEALKTEENYKRPHFRPCRKSSKYYLKKLGNYALFYSEADKTFFRVEFLCTTEVDTVDDIVSVRFLDTGIEEHVNLTNIYPMAEKLKKFPRFALKCHLTEISSVDSVNSVNWRSYDIDFMKEWISKNDRVIFVVDEGARKDGKSLPILLYDLEKAHCLNDEMRKIQESKHEDYQKLYKFVLEKWDPMSDAHESNLNTYDLDPDDPSCAVYGYVGRDYERLCKIYRKTGKCFKGDGCRKEHGLLHSSGYTTDKEEIFIEAFNSLRIPALGQVLQVEVTHITNGTQFHCIAFVKPDRSESLAALVSYMNQKENILQMKKISVPPAVGQIVTAKYSGDNFWYRAKIVDAIPENDEYVVFFVDYGNEETVPLSHLRMILPQFLHFPFQSMFCEIEGVVSSPDTQKESMEYLDEVCSSVVEIEVVSILPGFVPHLIVRLYTDKGEDVAQMMMEKKLVIPEEKFILNRDEMIPG